MKAVRTVVLSFLAVFMAMAAFAQPNPKGVPPTPTGYPTYTAAAAGGAWNANATWIGNIRPGPNSVVIIPQNVTVTIDHLETVAANAPKWVRVEGTLAVSTAVSTRFYVETIYVTPTGTFRIGTSPAPLPMGRTAEIIFTSPGTDFDKQWDPEQMSRGLVAEGKVRVFGISRTYAAAVTSDVPKGSRSMTLAVTPSNWQPNDQIVLAGTYFRRNAPFQDELRRIGSVNGTALTIAAGDAAYQFDHLHVSTAGVATPNFHLANLTRNVIFRSNTKTNTFDRGHIILMNSDSQVQWAALVDLGRTNKAVKLDDFYVDSALGKTVKRDPLQVTNKRGRYSLHVHKAGWGPAIAPPQTNITGCVVNNTPGWAFVNHGSNVDFRRNVAYDFTGAGFVAEDGDEIGFFVNNIAIRGRGNGQYLKGRINFANAQRPQAIADFAFNGDGFWFNGPAVKVNGAVANSCNGNGVIWHTTGAVDPTTANATYPYGRYSFFPKNQIVNVYGTAASTLQPRTWQGDANRAIISDLPIIQSTNIESYGNFIGFRLRFNNFDNVDWYTEDPFNYDNQIVPAPGQTDNRSVPTRLREAITNLKLWNDEAAFVMRYAGWADWTTVTAINRLDYDEVAPATNPSLNPIYGTEAFFRLDEMTFNGLTIDGWDIANFLANIVTNPNNPNGTITRTGTNITVVSPVYRNYAITGTWNQSSTATPCSQPMPGLISIGATQTTLRWTGSAGRYLVRYRISGAQQWNYVQTSGTSITVATTAGRQYVWQVMGGCSNTNTLSNWTTQQSFNT